MRAGGGQNTNPGEGNSASNISKIMGRLTKEFGQAHTDMKKDVKIANAGEKNLSKIDKAKHYTGKAVKHYGGAGARVAGHGARGTMKLAVKGLDSARDADKVNVLFWMTLVFHFFDAVLGFGMTFLRFILYILITLYAWMSVFSQEGVDFKALPGPLIVSLVAFIVPFAKLIPFVNAYVPASAIFDYFIIFFPIWPIYLAFWIGGTKTLIFFQTFFIGFWLVVAIPFVIAKADVWGLDKYAPRVEVRESFNNLKDFIWENLKTIWEGLRQTPTRLSQAWETQIALATGDYYTGRVDENENEPLGVYIENIKLGDPQVDEDEPVSVFALMKGKNLDPRYPLTITVRCLADGGRRPTYLRPKSNYKVDTIVEADLDCGFAKGLLGAGNKKIVFIAGFNFSTMAYVKSYFIDRENMRALVREDIDVFDHYGVKDKNPQSIFTNGPVMIGMQVTNPPVQLDMGNTDLSSSGQTMTLGITVDNRWEGLIRKVNELIIIMPDLFTLAYDDSKEGDNQSGLRCGGYVFRTCENYKNIHKDKEIIECRDREDNTNVYVLDQNGTNPNLGSVDVFKTLRCGIGIPDPKKVLGGVPMSTHYFKVTTRYAYTLTKSIMVKINEVEMGYKEVSKYTSSIWKGITINKDAGEPVDKVKESYPRYQPMIKRYVLSDKPDDFKTIEMEALIAAIITHTNGMFTDNDDDGVPDYIGNCLRYVVDFPDGKNPKGVGDNSNRLDPEGDLPGELKCISGNLKEALEKAHEEKDPRTATSISDDAVKHAIGLYYDNTNSEGAEPDGDRQKFVDGVFEQFEKWKNALAEPDTSTGASSSGPTPADASGLEAKIATYDSFISSAASKFGLEAKLIKAVIAQESAGNPDATSSAGARGLMQIMQTTGLAEVNNRFSADVGGPFTWDDMLDPEKNILTGSVYLKKACLDRFDGNIPLALAAYNGGPTKVEKECCSGNQRPCQEFDSCKAQLPSETQNYVVKVLSYYQAFT